VLTAEEEVRAAAATQRRLKREPVSRILGRREFWSLSLQVTPDTLDPRPDTETVVEAVLEAVPDRRAPLRLLDFGTGSGCILLALLSELPRAQGVGVDINPGAAAAAAENARRLGLGDRARFVVGDWGKEIDGAFDVIVSNPPYIPDEAIAGLEPEVHFDPPAALAGGADGLTCYRALGPELTRLLALDGVAALELGIDQGQAVRHILEENGLTFLRMRRDLAGIDRVIVCCRV
jgi:release factor glutamine methyltransferase